LKIVNLVIALLGNLTIIAHTNHIGEVVVSREAYELMKNEVEHYEPRGDSDFLIKSLHKNKIPTKKPGIASSISLYEIFVK